MRTEHSGSVVQLPTSCAQAVQQHQRKGRYPKAIGRLRDARVKRIDADLGRQAQQDEIARWEDSWHIALSYLEHIEGKLYALGSKPPSRTKRRD